MKIAFIINPRAGEGIYQRVNGSDRVAFEGNHNYSSVRAIKFLDNLSRRYEFVTASGKMGEDILMDVGFDHVEVAYKTPSLSTGEDTTNFVEFIKDKCDIILFAGGDGTARDIYKGSPKIPVLGIPSGMKMYSSIFAKDPEEAAFLIDSFSDGKTQPVEVMVEDADEDEMLKGNMVLRQYGTLISIGTGEIYHDPKIITYKWSEESISQYIIDSMDSSYYLIGTGSTCKSIMDGLGLESSIFTVDLIKDKKIVKSNFFPQDLDKYMLGNDTLKIVVSPYAGSGYFLGRGNRQIDIRAIRKAGKRNLIVVASEQKLETIRGLVYDVDGLETDFFGKFIKVICGYEQYKMIPLLL
jgi:predicted polyphosphate/ATP-dependent NAD kinase